MLKQVVHTVTTGLYMAEGRIFLFSFIYRGGVRLSAISTHATSGPTVPAPDDEHGMRMGRGN
jgi:hypothetical protein